MTERYGFHDDSDASLVTIRLQSDLGTMLSAVAGRDIAGAGIDYCSVGRIRIRLQEPDFATWHFTEAEIAYCETYEEGKRAQPYAARWAAKEVVVKILGKGVATGKEIEILNDEEGMPYVVLHGKAKTKAEERGIGRVLISLTHESTIAAAVGIGVH